VNAAISRFVATASFLPEPGRHSLYGRRIKA
jgi:hypothetical protein